MVDEFVNVRIWAPIEILLKFARNLFLPSPPIFGKRCLPLAPKVVNRDDRRHFPTATLDYIWLPSMFDCVKHFAQMNA
ncbi:MAG TPA: hypothetical protein VHR64_09440 [Thermomicrobiales bacterium]|nr:hypothetical protein [Thermomicrobiales bacterium]